MSRKRAIFLGITCLGMSSIITQIISLREFLSIFAGNELVLGIILGNWLLLTGIGSFLGRYAGRLRHPVAWLLFFQILTGVLPLFLISAIRLLRKIYVSGLMLGLNEAFVYSFFLLLPFCLVSGFMLPLFSGLGGTDRDAVQIGEVYVLDTFGDIAGGVLFSSLLIFFLSPFQTLTFLLLLNLCAAAVVIMATCSRRTLLPLLGVMIAALAFLFSHDLERLTGEAMFTGQQLLYQKSTPYGNLAVTRTGEQTTVYENSIPVGTTGNIVAAEETVHYALSQHAAPKSILLISGGVDGALAEAVKYKVEKIDYVELDPAMIELVRKLGPGGRDSRLAFVAEDGRRFIRSKANTYDAILMALADPANAQLNRFYTVEFFREVKRALKKDGVFSFSLSGAENYGGPEIRFLSSSVYHSLAEVFANILIIPGSRQFFIASEADLSYDIGNRLRQRGIETRYVNNNYLAARLTADRRAAGAAMVAGPAAHNLDFVPVSYYANLRYWLASFQDSLLIPFSVILLIGAGTGYLTAAARQRTVAAALCTSGFSGMGLEIVILLAFQICHGFVYQQIGVIVTAFLAGTAGGAAWATHRKTDARALIFRLDLALAVVSFLLIPFILQMNDSRFLPDFLPLLLFPAYTLVIGFLVGGQFPPAARLLFSNVEETAATLYSLDFLGACLGALLISTFAVPLLGITRTCFLIGLIKLASSTLLALLQPAPHGAAAVSRPEADRSPLAAFLLMLLFLAVIGGSITVDKTSTAIYALSFAPAYHWVLLAIMAAGILRAMDINPWPQRHTTAANKRRTSAGISFYRWFNFLAFSLAVFYPVFRCYFKIPYLFCHACPRLCIFGYMRPYLVPAALIMNLEKRKWCFTSCPIGTISDCQARTTGRTIRLPAVIRILPLTILAFTAISYFKVKTDLDFPGQSTTDWYMLFYNNIFATSVTVIVITIGLIILGFFIRRSFCELLCPVGTLSDLVLRFERLCDKKTKVNSTPAEEPGAADA